MTTNQINKEQTHPNLLCIQCLLKTTLTIWWGLFLTLSLNNDDPSLNTFIHFKPTARHMVTSHGPVT